MSGTTTTRRRQGAPGSGGRRTGSRTAAAAGTGGKTRASAGRAKARTLPDPASSTRTNGKARNGKAPNGRVPSGKRTSGKRTSRPTAAAREADQATFRRRRAVALVLMLALIVGLAVGVKAVIGAVMPAGGGETALPRELSAPLPHDVDPAGPPSEFELANPVECRPSALEVTLEQPAATVKKDTTTTFGVTVHNVGQVPCLVEVGKAQLVLTIYSGDDRVWTSTHCADLDTGRRILLDIGGEDATSFTWTGTRSAASCPKDPSIAKPGTYRVVATLLGTGDEPKKIATAEETFTVK